MKHLFQIAIVAFAMMTSLTLTSCEGDGEANGVRTQEEDPVAEMKGNSDDHARIITLPTPMQVLALLRNTQSNYSTSNLLPIVTDKKSYYKSGILFGTYMLDLAYAACYGHQQANINYFRVYKRIGDDLGLGVRITENYVDRFEQNVSRPDSLGKIILNMYDLGHKVLIDQEKEGLGFLMVLGCYMEGMNLVIHQAREHDLVLFVHLLHQQKNYGNNLVSMLDPYEIPNEIQTEYSNFMTVVESLNGIDIPTVYELKSGKRTIAGLEEGNFDTIKDQLSEFRSSIQI